MLTSYGANDRREDLLSILKDLSPLGGNWLMGNLGTGIARNTLHEWVTYNQTRPTSVTASVEGFDATFTAPTTPERSNNITAIVAETVKVSRTHRNIAIATNEDPYAFQKQKALARMNAKMEFLLLNGTKASGATGTARGMAGVDACISTNFTSVSSGTSLTMTAIEDLLQKSYDQVGTEYVANTLIVPMVLKRRISSLTTNITNYVNETDALYKDVYVLYTSFGQIRIVHHRDVKASGGSAHIYAIRPEIFKVAYLEGSQPFWKDLPANGDFDAGMYVTEFTLESLAERACVKSNGWATTQ